MKHKFVEFIPSDIEEGTLYISIEYDVAKHKCACGCGSDIVTSLSPAQWRLIYDGETVSLQPSIGNWNHECRSHYFITNNKIQWSTSMSQHEIQKVIKNDQQAIKNHVKHVKPKKTFIQKLKDFLGL
ncbi:DUF6527 family protein [Exiguobacterium sp. s146]|uniref:DUF6527 family protein n=1 Tax=Exiguobacterium sp. s146 TaxID=2751223 RepID=UPI001BE6E114|nr:DUF6527 family protein [Exiguobacterium sp. s146]